MSTGLLERRRRAPESLLSDQVYRGRTLNERTPRRAPAPPITIGASQPFTAPFGEGQFEFEQEPPKWFMPLLTKVCELGDLPSDWDSYGARPIDPETAASAVTLLLDVLSADDPQPAVVPTSRGGILVEWHEGGVDLEVDVRSSSSIHVAFEDGVTEQEFENPEPSLLEEKIGTLRDRLQRATGNG